ncbi:MAG: peptidylprolyl isomerase [Nanoarchaeota archaeon]|nr:peptidylprolyl isomerase [Nanoarchaeota archaeon]
MTKKSKEIRIKKSTLHKIILSLIILILLIIFIKTITSENKIINDIGDKMTNTIIVIETNKGTIEAELYSEKAPISVKNFLAYVEEGYYNGLIFHRVMPDFMIQGGGFDPEMNEKDTKAPIKNEADNGLKNVKYTLAMARTMDVDSATSQFFINVEDNPFLDNGFRDFGYAVFGKVVSGFDVVDAIKMVPTKTVGPYEKVPVEPVIMEKVYVKK